MEDLLEVLYPPESLTKWARILVPTNKESRQVLEASRGYAAEKALLRTIAERDCVSHGAWTMPIFRWRITAERVVPGGWLTRETTQMQPCVVADNSSGFHSRMIEASAAVATLKQCLMVFGEVEGGSLLSQRLDQELGVPRCWLLATLSNEVIVVLHEDPRHTLKHPEPPVGSVSAQALPRNIIRRTWARSGSRVPLPASASCTLRHSAASEAGQEG